MMKNRANKGYTHFAVLKSNNLIVNGWDYKGYDVEDLMSDKRYYFLEDVRDMQIEPKLVKILKRNSLISMGIDPFDYENWNKDTSIYTL
jgi:hypothetical protein